MTDTTLKAVRREGTGKGVARKMRQAGGDWEQLAWRTSNIPFRAIVQGRNTLEVVTRAFNSHDDDDEASLDGWHRVSGEGHLLPELNRYFEFDEEEPLGILSEDGLSQALSLLGGQGVEQFNDLANFLKDLLMSLLQVGLAVCFAD